MILFTGKINNSDSFYCLEGPREKIVGRIMTTKRVLWGVLLQQYNFVKNNNNWNPLVITICELICR